MRLKEKHLYNSKYKYIFIAGPFTASPSECTGEAIRIADRAALEGFIPFCPHLYILWDIKAGHSYEFWMKQTLSWIEKCDAVYRLVGESKGADREVARAEELGIPVVYTYKELVNLKYTPDLHCPSCEAGLFLTNLLSVDGEVECSECSCKIDEMEI